MLAIWKEVVMSNKAKAPINDLNEIAKRKQQLRAKIEMQERKLSQDLDAYQDDIDTFKKTWNSLKGIKRVGENISISGISQAVKALPIGRPKATGNKSRLLTAFTLGAEVVSWIIQRRKNRKLRNK